MAASNYEAALARVLKHEGGYTDHPSDPGGPTNFGMTIADYARFKGRAVSAAEVRAMPLADAKAIYRARYWDALRCDELPAGLDYALFDYGVNSGTGRAAKVLRRLLGQGADGGVTGAVIAQARAADTVSLVARLCEERLAFLKSLKTWPVFGAGWGRRVAEVRRDALAMAKARAAPSAPNMKRIATAAAGVGAGAGAAQAAHAAGASPALVVAVLAAGAMLAAVGWLVWKRRARISDGAA
jgi:lysozyme family protein